MGSLAAGATGSTYHKLGADLGDGDVVGLPIITLCHHGAVLFGMLVTLVLLWIEARRQLLRRLPRPLSAIGTALLR